MIASCALTRAAADAICVARVDANFRMNASEIDLTL